MSKIEYRGTLVCSINVSDLDRSIRWYRDGLGFEEIHRMEDYGWCEMRSPIDGVTIGLQRTESGLTCNPQERGLMATSSSYRAKTA
jgi:catechol 2,3-dioxygenase-like lactoylglutathione lyase family enzyme